MMLHRYPLAFAGLISGIILFAVSSALDVDVFEEFVKVIALGERYELDELILPVVLLMIGVVADFFMGVQTNRREREKLHVYRHMNEEVMNEISTQLTKLLEFRTSLLQEGANSKDVGHELDRMIVRTFNHYERAQRRGDIDANLMPLVMTDVDAIAAKLGEKK
jgi:hypothetical protein